MYTAAAGPNSKGPDRLSDVLDLLETTVIVSKGQRLSDVLMGRAGDAHPSRFSERLEPRRDVHAIPEEVSPFHHHVAHMHANAKENLTILRHCLVNRPERALDRNSRLDRIHDARELRQNTVPRRVGNPAPMLADEPVHDLPVSREGPQGPDLI